MKKWNDMGDDERREWRESPVSQAAIGMLRDLEVMARDSLVSSTENGSIEDIKFNGGFLRGFSAAIDALTTERK